MKMFYGWYIVGAALITALVHSTISIYGFTAFIDPLAATFGWTYAQISLAISLRGLETGTLNPLFGVLVDRWPARPLAIFGIIMIGLGYFCLSYTTNLFMFYLSFIIMGFGGSLGAGMVPQTTIARWFRKDLGKASGIYTMGHGLGGLFIPLLVMAIDTYGWKICTFYVAIIILVIGVPLSMVYRTRPEEYGLRPDGNSQKKGIISGSGKDIIYPDVEVSEALKMKAFWFLGATNLIQMGSYSALITHLMPYLSSMGIDRSVGGMVTMGFLMVSLGVRFPVGWLSDIFDKRHMMSTTIMCLAASFITLWSLNGDSHISIYLFIIIAGIAAGGLMPIRMPIMREYFGVKNFGKIFGLGSIFITLGAICGPPLAGWVYDTKGIYDPVWIVFSGMNIVAAILVLMIPPAQKAKK